MKRKSAIWLWMLVVFSTFALTAMAFGGEAAKSDFSKEGIKVHGHWKIEILNPDGTRASVTEFDNYLYPPGKLWLAKLLTGEISHGSWGIDLHSDSTNDPCENLTSSGPGACLIGEPDGYYGGLNNAIQSRVLSVSHSSAQPYEIILQGETTAAYDAAVEWVNTTYSFCEPVRSDCKGNENNLWQPFTGTNLTQPPTVVPDQLIQVTITISFSS
jgi:hypothetical protein